VQIERTVLLGGYLDAVDDRLLMVVYGLLALAYSAIGLVVYVRRPEESRALVFYLLCLAIAVSFLAALALTGPVMLRGFHQGIPIPPEFLLSFALILLASYVIMALFLHFALLFPRRRPLLRARPELVGFIHGTGPVLVLASLAALLAGRVARGLPAPAALALLAALGVAVAVLLLRLRRERLRPLPWFALVVLAWAGLALAMVLLRPVLGDVVKWILVLLFLLPLALSVTVPIAAGVLTLVALGLSYRESDLEARQQIRWPLVALGTNILGGGIVLAASLILPNALGPGGTVDMLRWFEYVSVLSSLLIPVAFAVAILKYRLFDLGLVVRRTATYGLATFALAVVYLALVAGVGGVLVAPLGAQAGPWPAVLGTLGVAALFVPARNWAQRLVDRSFFRVRYDATTSLGRLGRTLSTAPDAPARAKAAIEELVSSLRLRGAAVDLRSPDGRAVARAAALGTAVSPASAATPLVPWTPELAQALAGGEPVAPERLPAPARDVLRAGRCELVVPLARQGRPFGWVAAGARLSDEPLDGDDRAFVAAVAEQLALAIGPGAEAGSRRELDEARQIQAALLPQGLPRLGGHTLAAHWQPAREVAGDYYDVLAVGEDAVALCIADVAGKGMPAALLMSNLQATVKAFAAGDPGPSELCARVNRAFAGNLAPGRFITLFYARLDAPGGTLTYANAGHNPPLLLRADGAVEWLAEGGPLLGPFAEASFAEATVTLAPGDRLVCYTDGVTEAMDAAGTLFGEERLHAAASGGGVAGADAVLDRLLGAVRAFCQDEFDDDATILVVAADPGSR
jgi:hypothetical protein